MFGGERRARGKGATVLGGEGLSAGRMAVEWGPIRRRGAGVDVLLGDPRRPLLVRGRSEGFGGRNPSAPRTREGFHGDRREREAGTRSEVRNPNSEIETLRDEGEEGGMGGLNPIRI